MCSAGYRAGQPVGAELMPEVTRRSPQTRARLDIPSPCLFVPPYAIDQAPHVRDRTLLWECPQSLSLTRGLCRDGPHPTQYPPFYR